MHFTWESNPARRISRLTRCLHSTTHSRVQVFSFTRKLITCNLTVCVGKKLGNTTNIFSSVFRAATPCVSQGTFLLTFSASPTVCKNVPVATHRSETQCGRVPPPHATEVAFLGLLRHRTRVDVVEDVYLEFYRQLVFAELMVCWSWLWLLLECVCWWLVYPGVPWLLMHPRCAAPPSQSPISLTQARWGCKPAINNTHPPHIPNTKLRLGRIPSLAYSPPPSPIQADRKKNTYRTLNRVTIPTKKPDSLQGHTWETPRTYLAVCLGQLHLAYHKAPFCLHFRHHQLYANMYPWQHIAVKHRHTAHGFFL